MQTKPEVLRLSEGTSLTEARAALERSGEALALVTSMGIEVGLVTIDDLERGVGSGATVLGDVMRREVVSIDPHTDLQHTLRTYSDAAWDSAIRRRPAQVSEPSPPPR